MARARQTVSRDARDPGTRPRRPPRTRRAAPRPPSGPPSRWPAAAVAAVAVASSLLAPAVAAADRLARRAVTGDLMTLAATHDLGSIPAMTVNDEDASLMRMLFKRQADGAGSDPAEVCGHHVAVSDPNDLSWDDFTHLFSNERHITAWLLGLLATVIATVWSLILIGRHLRRFRATSRTRISLSRLTADDSDGVIVAPASTGTLSRWRRHWQWTRAGSYEEAYVVRILIMVPIYAIFSWLALRYYTYAMYLLIVRDMYEAFALYNFFHLLLLMVGPSGPAEQQRRLSTLPPMQPLWPLNWVKGWYLPGNPKTLYVLRTAVLQYCFVRIICTFLAFAMESRQRYCPDSMSPQYGHFWYITLNSISVTISMYGLVILYEIVHKVLEQDRDAKLEREKAREREEHARQFERQFPQLPARPPPSCVAGNAAHEVLAVATTPLMTPSQTGETDADTTVSSTRAAAIREALAKKVQEAKSVPHRPLLKFLSVKLVIFLVFWQLMALSLLASANVFTSTYFWTADNIVNGIDCFLVCWEMLIVVFMQSRAFPTGEWEADDEDDDEDGPHGPHAADGDDHDPALADVTLDPEHAMTLQRGGTLRGSGTGHATPSRFTMTRFQPQINQHGMHYPTHHVPTGWVDHHVPFPSTAPPPPVSPAVAAAPAAAARDPDKHLSAASSIAGDDVVSRRSVDDAVASSMRTPPVPPMPADGDRTLRGGSDADTETDTETEAEVRRPRSRSPSRSPPPSRGPRAPRAPRTYLPWWVALFYVCWPSDMASETGQTVTGRRRWAARYGMIYDKNVGREQARKARQEALEQKQAKKLHKQLVRQLKKEQRSGSLASAMDSMTDRMTHSGSSITAATGRRRADDGDHHV